MKLKSPREYNTNDRKEKIVENLKSYVSKVTTNDEFKKVIQTHILEEPYLTFPEDSKVTDFVNQVLGKTNTYNEALQETLEFIGLYESDSPIQYNVVLKGGSIGEKNIRSARDLKGEKVIDEKDLFTDKDKAKDKAKRMNKYLSPGEKKYYGLKYIVVQVQDGKYNGK